MDMSSSQAAIFLAFGAGWVISIIAQGLLWYRAFLHTVPSVTIHRVAWSQWLFLRREEFTPLGWRYRQAAVACWGIPFATGIATAIIVGR
jgi:hypothetical protein